MGDNNIKLIELPAQLTVRELALAIQASPIEVIKILMSNGVMANINQQIDYDTAAIVATELGFEAKLELPIEEGIKETGEVPLWRQLIANENPKKLISRPPVVTILGHVDHGKTTLLDAIRHTDVASGEIGGITQHIGAYQVEHKNQLITFLDTPGHAAFTAMRARGAQGADIVILVVAADDGVMPQTREAISHARAARVPIIVALNKIDRPDANPDFAKKQLAENGLIPDDWEGDTLIIPVSAKQKTGLDDLLEAILLIADTLQIQANPEGKVFGTVTEAKVDKNQGVLTSLLVQNGELQVGDVIVAGASCGKIRAMFDFHGKKIRKAGPSTPVQVTGLGDVPEAGDVFQTYSSEKEARQRVNEIKLSQQEKLSATPKATLEELFERFQSGEVRELPLIIKADVQGSLEPITNSLKDLNSGELKINILHAETGNISESDIMLATASKAIVIGFSVQADTAARRLADTEGVSIRLYDIIYRMIEDIEKALKGMLAPEYKENIIGQADILQIFRVSKVGAVAGCKVTLGEIRRNARTRIKRGDLLVFEGEIASLKHERDDIKEVRLGFECGISFKNFNQYEVGDRVVCYTLERIND
jgi:translation initiation factor IF-2